MLQSLLDDVWIARPRLSRLSPVPVAQCAAMSRRSHEHASGPRPQSLDSDRSATDVWASTVRKRGPHGTVAPHAAGFRWRTAEEDHGSAADPRWLTRAVPAPATSSKMSSDELGAETPLAADRASRRGRAVCSCMSGARTASAEVGTPTRPALGPLERDLPAPWPVRLTVALAPA